MYELAADFIVALNYSTIGAATISAFAVLGGATVSVLFDRSKREPTDDYRRSETRRANDAARKLRTLEATLLRVRAERTVYREALIRAGVDPNTLRETAEETP